MGVTGKCAVAPVQEFELVRDSVVRDPSVPPPVTLNALASERMWPYPWRLPRTAIPLRCRCHRTPQLARTIGWSSFRDEHATWVDRKEIDRHSDGLPQCLDFLLYAVYAPFLEELYLVRTVFAEEQGGSRVLAMEDAAAESNALSSPLGLPIASLSERWGSRWWSRRGSRGLVDGDRRSVASNPGLG